MAEINVKAGMRMVSSRGASPPGDGHAQDGADNEADDERETDQHQCPGQIAGDDVGDRLGSWRMRCPDCHAAGCRGIAGTARRAAHWLMPYWISSACSAAGEMRPCMRASSACAGSAGRQARNEEVEGHRGPERDEIEAKTPDQVPHAPLPPETHDMRSARRGGGLEWRGLRRHRAPTLERIHAALIVTRATGAGSAARSQSSGYVYGDGSAYRLP